MIAGVAALSGPDNVSGNATVSALFVSHQNFALLTVSFAVSLVIVRLFAADGIAGVWALGYLACTVALLTVVALTGYYGGEMVYHQAIGVSLRAGAGVPAGDTSVLPHLPVKPMVALLGFLCIVGLGGWLAVGRLLVPQYYDSWWRAVRLDRATGGAIWTLRLRSSSLATSRRVASAALR
jgi:hypothetical protein